MKSLREVSSGVEVKHGLADGECCLVGVWLLAFRAFGETSLFDGGRRKHILLTFSESLELSKLLEQLLSRVDFDEVAVHPGVDGLVLEVT